MTLRCLVAVLMLSAVPAAGHHSFASEYDASKPVTLTGVVTRLDWLNPHIWLYLNVKDATGTTANWAVSGSPPGFLLRRGLTREAIRPGTAIRIDGFRARDGSDNACGSTITLGDGRRFVMSGNGVNEKRP